MVIFQCWREQVVSFSACCSVICFWRYSNSVCLGSLFSMRKPVCLGEVVSDWLALKQKISAKKSVNEVTEQLRYYELCLPGSPILVLLAPAEVLLLPWGRWSPAPLHDPQSKMWSFISEAMQPLVSRTQLLCDLDSIWAVLGNERLWLAFISWDSTSLPA